MQKKLYSLHNQKREAQKIARQQKLFELSHQKDAAAIVQMGNKHNKSLQDRFVPVPAVHELVQKEIFQIVRQNIEVEQTARRGSRGVDDDTGVEKA